MNAFNLLISKQSEWAKNKNLQLVGSLGPRGRKVYTRSIEENLFQPLNKQTKENLEHGDGNELAGSEAQPAKIQAVHSSSALGINLFDYWRGSADLSIITTACRLSRANRKLCGEMLFEQKFPIDDRFRYPPNIDVVIIPKTGRYRVYAIECKFAEPYSSHKHDGLDGKYLKNDDIWQSLTSTKCLAQAISPDDSRFRYLHAAQLIKHILGLNREFGHSRYRLLYLWYDVIGEASHKHRQEIKQFSDIVGSDGVAFREVTYQDAISRLAKHREDHSEYISYITERYL
jgi:hypothetical protein